MTSNLPMKVKRFEEKKPRARPACTYSPPGKRGRVLAVDNQPANKLDLLPLQLSRTLFRNQNRAPWKKETDNALRPKKNKNKKIKKLKFQIPEHEKKKQKQKKTLS